MMKRYGVLCMLLFFTIGIRFITVGQNGTDQDGKILQNFILVIIFCKNRNI